ncbi:MAG: endospore germination permease [Caldicoprobacterales bacterium]|nr:endospore germination permease [Clostridiales bacterium]
MENEKLTTSQIFVITVFSILGVDVLVVPHNMVTLVDQDAWISLILGGLLLYIGAIPFLYLLNLYPDKDLPQIILQVAGKWLGRILLLPIIIFVVMYAGMSTRLFAQALKLFLVDKTPIWIMVILLVIVAAYVVYKDVHTMGAVLDILFPISIVTLIILIVLSLQNIEPDRIKPILFRNTKNVLKAIIPGFYHFAGFGAISYFLRYAANRKSACKSYLLGLGVPVFFYVVTTVICIMVFGAPPLKVIVYPTLNLSKSIEFEAAILDRLESFMAVFWISLVFSSLVLFYYSSVRNFSEFFSIPGKYTKYVILAHILMLPIIALLPPSSLYVFELHDKVKYMEVLIGFGIFPIVTVWAAIKKKRGMQQ